MEGNSSEFYLGEIMKLLVLMQLMQEIVVFVSKDGHTCKIRQLNLLRSSLACLVTAKCTPINCATSTGYIKMCQECGGSLDFQSKCIVDLFLHLVPYSL